MLPPATPDTVQRVLRWALAKDPKHRLRDIADARLELEAAATSPSPAPTAGSTRPRWLTRSAWTAAIVMSAALGAIASRSLSRAPAAAAPLEINLAIPVDAHEVLAREVAISADGRYVAYIAGPSGNQRTYFRGVGDRHAKVVGELPLQATQPFFSPDSQWLAFFDAGKLKKLAVHGGAPVTLAEAPTPRGGAWGSDGSIVFAPISRGGLMWLPANGGTAQVLTTLDASQGETSHRFPTFLAQSRTVLFTAERTTTSEHSLRAVSPDTHQISVVVDGDARTARYVPTGHLAYLAGTNLVVAAFDVKLLRVTGAPVTVAAHVDSFSFTAAGTLVYSEAAQLDTRMSTLVWTARDGTTTALPLPAAVYDQPRISGDGRSLVVHKNAAGDRHLWLYDITRDTFSKFTLDYANEWAVWAADGRRVIYSSNRPGTDWDIYSKPVDGSAREQAVLARPLTQIPRAVAPNGDELIFEEIYADRPNTLWRMSLRASGEPRLLFGAGAGEMMPSYSPDGRWIAYVSPESARNEVYVRSSAGEGRTWQISNNGGVEPVWSFNGRELFYREDDKMMVVDVDQSPPQISFGKPRVLFEGPYIFGMTEGQEFDVSRDGRRFLMLKPQLAPTVTPLTVVVNWFDELQSLASASIPH